MSKSKEILLSTIVYNFKVYEIYTNNISNYLISVLIIKDFNCLELCYERLDGVVTLHIFSKCMSQMRGACYMAIFI